jgi:hypothetical protein
MSTHEKKVPTLAEVDVYPVPEMLIPRIAKEHDYSLAYAAGALKEAKRMMYLNVVSRESTSPSQLIDMAWHEMMLFTKFYHEFCSFLGMFIHHDPTEGPPDGGRLYDRTKENYEKFFGIKPDNQYWA